MDNEDKKLEFVNERILKPSFMKRYGFVVMCTVVALFLTGTILLYSGQLGSQSESTSDSTYFKLNEGTTTEHNEVHSQYEKNKQLTNGELKNLAEGVKNTVATIMVYDSSKLHVGAEPSMVTTGIVIRKGVNIIIATDYVSCRGAERIEIKFSDDNKYVASLKKGDDICNVAILTIESSEVTGGTYAKIKEVSIGNSQTVKSGNQIVYIGNPINESRYVDYGMISGEDRKIVVDRRLNAFYTNINSAGKQNGFVFDVDGQVIGMVQNIASSSQNILSVIGITDIKTVMERLSNGMSMTYLGVIGRTVTDEIIAEVDENMPKGVYVTESVVGSPLYYSGVIAGDIITKVGNVEISSLADISNVLDTLNSGDTLTITFYRKSSKGYSEYSVKVKLAARI